MSENYEFIDGLTETTEEDQECFDELMSMSVPFTAHWADLDNAVKCLQWDSAFERYLQHSADLIKEEGREKFLPWNLYKSLGVRWLDGYNYRQLRGDCCGESHRNATKRSKLTMAARLGMYPREIASSIAYGIARGNGKMQMGNGLNLNPMAKWSATVGNFWVEDFGRYDGGNNASKWRKGSPACANALKTQSVIVYLPEPKFDYVFSVCDAGFGINMGTGVYPTSAILGNDRLAEPKDWRSGGHAMSFVGAWRVASGKRYVYLENTHGARYVGDSLHPDRQPGLWVDEANFKKIAAAGGFRYGIWYVALCEMG